MSDNGRPKRQKSGRDLKAICSACRLRGLCLPAFVDLQHADQHEFLVTKRLTFSPKDNLFEIDDDFKSIYVVQSGSVLTYMIAPKGEMQVMGFFFPGEFFGFDGIMDGKHHHCARALETTGICVVPFSSAKSSKLLQSYVNQILCKELEVEEERIYMLAQQTAEVRFTSFLLNLSSRYARCKLSPLHIHLPMARNEIANYLGLTIETVSRTLHHLQSKKLISIKDRDLEILSLEGLVNVCGHTDCRYKGTGTCIYHCQE